MSDYIAALPMYDWPEVRGETDMEWVRLKRLIRDAGIDAPETLTRDSGDLHDLWRQPNLLLAQTCWGPMERGLGEHVVVVGQPSYDGFEGGKGTLYSSAILMRRGAGHDAAPAADGSAGLPLEVLRGRRLAYNADDSMSGIIALTRDLDATGESLDLFAERVATGAHRASIVAVAAGRADVCAIDCRSWHLAKRHEPAAGNVEVVGWTSLRPGLPMITSKRTAPDVVEKLRAILRP